MVNPVNRIRELKEKEEDLWQEGAFSQGDVQRQNQINQKIDTIAEKYGVDPSNVEGYETKLEGETDSGGSVDVGTTTLSDPSSGEPIQAVIVGSNDTKQSKSSVEKVQEAARDQGAEQFAENVQTFQERTDTATVRPQGVEGIQLSGTKTVEEKRQIRENQTDNGKPEKNPSQVRPDTREVDTPTAGELFYQRMNQGVPEDQEAVQDFLQARERNPLLAPATPQFTEAVETRQENLQAQNQVQQNLQMVTGLEPGTSLAFGTGEDKKILSPSEAEEELEEKQEEIQETMQENEQLFFESQTSPIKPVSQLSPEQAAEDPRTSLDDLETNIDIPFVGGEKDIQLEGTAAKAGAYVDTIFDPKTGFELAGQVIDPDTSANEVVLEKTIEEKRESTEGLDPWIDSAKETAMSPPGLLLTTAAGGAAFSAGTKALKARGLVRTAQGVKLGAGAVGAAYTAKEGGEAAQDFRQGKETEAAADVLRLATEEVGFAKGATSASRFLSPDVVRGPDGRAVVQGDTDLDLRMTGNQEFEGTGEFEGRFNVEAPRISERLGIAESGTGEIRADFNTIGTDTQSEAVGGMEIELPSGRTETQEFEAFSLEKFSGETPSGDPLTVTSDTFRTQREGRLFTSTEDVDSISRNIQTSDETKKVIQENEDLGMLTSFDARVRTSTSKTDTDDFEVFGEETAVIRTDTGDVDGKTGEGLTAGGDTSGGRTAGDTGGTKTQEGLTTPTIQGEGTARTVQENVELDPGLETTFSGAAAGQETTEENTTELGFEEETFGAEAEMSGPGTGNDFIDEFSQEVERVEGQNDQLLDGFDERQGIAGSPTTDIDEGLTRGTTTGRLTLPAPEPESGTGEQQQQESLFGTVQDPGLETSTGQTQQVRELPDPPVGTELVNEPMEMFTRGSTMFEPPILDRLETDTSTGLNTMGLNTEIGLQQEQGPSLSSKPLEAGEMGLIRGQTPLFRVEQVPEEAQIQRLDTVQRTETMEAQRMNVLSPGLGLGAASSPGIGFGLPDFGDEQGEFNSGSGEFEEKEEDAEFAPSLASAIGLGPVIEEENVQGNLDDETFTGLSNRPFIIDEENEQGPDQGFF